MRDRGNASRRVIDAVQRDVKKSVKEFHPALSGKYMDDGGRERKAPASQYPRTPPEDRGQEMLQAAIEYLMPFGDRADGESAHAVRVLQRKFGIDQAEGDNIIQSALDSVRNSRRDPAYGRTESVKEEGEVVRDMQPHPGVGAAPSAPDEVFLSGPRGRGVVNGIRQAFNQAQQMAVDSPDAEADKEVVEELLGALLHGSFDVWQRALQAIM